jgi:putative transposase
MMTLRSLVEKAPDADLLREMIRCAAARLMEPEVGGLTGAGYSEKIAERSVQRNAYRDRVWETRAGTVELLIRKLRRGSYLTGFLEPRRRAEKALARTHWNCRSGDEAGGRASGEAGPRGSRRASMRSRSPA